MIHAIRYWHDLANAMTKLQDRTHVSNQVGVLWWYSSIGTLPWWHIDRIGADLALVDHLVTMTIGMFK